MTKDVLTELYRQFSPGAYYKPVVEGWQMNLMEQIDSPIYQCFFLLLDKEKSQILKIIQKSSLGLSDEKDLLADGNTPKEFYALLRQQKLTATVFN